MSGQHTSLTHTHPTHAHILLLLQLTITPSTWAALMGEPEVREVTSVGNSSPLRSGKEWT